MKVQSNALTLHSKCQHKIFVAHPECNAIEIKHRNQRIIFLQSSKFVCHCVESCVKLRGRRVFVELFLTIIICERE